MTSPYLWIIDTHTDIATRVRVLRVWRWRGYPGMRRGVFVLRGHITRVVVDYLGTRRMLTLWRDAERFRLYNHDAPPEGIR
jgi:hypothetical protein